MSEPAHLRVSDQERERAAEEIREHFAAGRLDEDELNERVASAYAAKTSGELAALRADLPRLPVTAAQTRAELAQRRRELMRRTLQQAGGGVALFVVCTVIWLTDGATGQFWPIWVALLVVIPLLRNGWRLYGPAPELERVERHLARREGRDRPRDQRARGGRGRRRRGRR